MVVTAQYRSGTHAFRHGGTGTDDGHAGGTYTGRVDGDVAQVAGEEDVPAVRARGAAHPLQGGRRGCVRRTGHGHARWKTRKGAVMGVPVVYTDFDGVLNAFPDDKVLRRGGVGHTGWLKDGDPRKPLYDAARAFRLDGNEQARTPVGRFRIHWSTELTGAMYHLAVDGRVELNWLSTWQPYCVNTLDPMLGWDPSVVHNTVWYDPVTMERRLTGKLSTVLSRVRVERESDDPLPIVWIDDEECYSDAVEEVGAENPAAPVLMVRPDMHIGISRRQWEIIERFVDDWTGFPPVTFDDEDDEDGGRAARNGHVGL